MRRLLARTCQDTGACDQVVFSDLESDIHEHSGPQRSFHRLNMERKVKVALLEIQYDAEGRVVRVSADSDFRYAFGV